MLRSTYDPAVLIKSHPLAGRGIDMVVHIEGQQDARIVRPIPLCPVLHDAAIHAVIVVAMEIRHAHEIKDREAGLADVLGLPRPPSSHLAVEDAALGEPRHNQIDYLRAIETGIEHVYAD